MSSGELERALLERVYSVLKPEGFKRRGGTFSCDRGDVILLVQVQKSVASTKDAIILTVNLGVFSREVARRLGFRVERPTLPDCHWRTRIGFLLPERKDKWWTVSSDEEAVQAGQEINNLLTRQALGALAEVGSTEKLREFWTRGEYGGLSEMERKDYLRAISS